MELNEQLNNSHVGLQSSTHSQDLEYLQFIFGQAKKAGFYQPHIKLAPEWTERQAHVDPNCDRIIFWSHLAVEASICCHIPTKAELLDLLNLQIPVIALEDSLDTITPPEEWLQALANGIVYRCTHKDCLEIRNKNLPRAVRNCHIGMEPVSLPDYFSIRSEKECCDFVATKNKGGLEVLGFTVAVDMLNRYKSRAEEHYKDRLFKLECEWYTAFMRDMRNFLGIKD
jgi:hypothetical protein